MREPTVSDTGPAARQRQLERWREMSPAERAAVASRLSVGVTRLAIAGILAERPAATPDELRHELARRRYGQALADAVFGQRPGT